MTTIAVSNATKRRLLEVAADLQRRLGRKVDFDDAISYLISLYEENAKRYELFELFCSSIKEASFEELYRELVEERRRDEKRRGQKFPLLP